MNSEKQLAKFVTAFAMLAILAVPVRSAHADTLASGAPTPVANISIASLSPATVSSPLAGTGSSAIPSYEVRTSGSVVGSIGTYRGSLVVSLIPESEILLIPESEIFTMILAGLGLIGFVVRRRRV
jgi:hypothetical protein